MHHQLLLREIINIGRSRAIVRSRRKAAPCRSHYSYTTIHFARQSSLVLLCVFLCLVRYKMKVARSSFFKALTFDEKNHVQINHLFFNFIFTHFYSKFPPCTLRVLKMKKWIKQVVELFLLSKVWSLSSIVIIFDAHRAILVLNQNSKSRIYQGYAVRYRLLRIIIVSYSLPTANLN